MRFIYASYSMLHNCVDVTTFDGYVLRIDCGKAEEGLKTIPCSECALNALAIDNLKTVYTLISYTKRPPLITPIYRWFCGLDLMHRVPDHSTFSQNRKRRFKDSGIFREIFNGIVLRCIQLGIVSGETGVADGSFLPSNVSWDSRYEVVETSNRSTIKYMEELEAELSSMPGYKKPENVEAEKKSW